jgi:hypothetical protein
MKMSATEVSNEPPHGVDAQYCGRAMRPAAMVAWYSGIPNAVELVADWARAWSEDTVRAGAGKPAGIMPATIRFEDDNVDGPRDTWWEPGLGDLYDWRPGRQDMVLGKILGAWLMTGDDALLAGPRAQFEILRQCRAEPVSDPPVGSLGWAGAQLLGETQRLVGMYRGYTGDSQFDDLLAHVSGYERFMATGDPQAVEAAHAAELNSMRVNLPMVTSEVRGTDRVDLRPFSLIGPLTGSPVSITEPPSFAVTWRNVDPDFTALVRSASLTGLSAWVYSFGEKECNPEARFWRLDPGRYELRVAPDHDGDGTPDDASIQTVSFDRTERLTSAPFTLPPTTLCLIDVAQIESASPLPPRAPDLAVMPRDIVLSSQPTTENPVTGTVTVHNIGSQRAENVVIQLTAAKDETDATPIPIAEVPLGTLAFPEDLTPKTAVAEFSWTPPSPGTWRLAAVAKAVPHVNEIYSGNNRASVQVVVKK